MTKLKRSKVEKVKSEEQVFNFYPFALFNFLPSIALPSIIGGIHADH